MGFLIHGPGRTAKLYFSVPVELYTVFSDLNNLAQKPGQRSGQKSDQNMTKILSKSGPKSGHADHVLKTGL